MTNASAIKTGGLGQRTGSRRNRRQGTRHASTHDSRGPRTPDRAVHQNARARPTTGYQAQPIRAAKPGQTKRRGLSAQQGIDKLVQTLMGGGIVSAPRQAGKATALNAHNREMLEDYTDEDLRVVAKDLGIKRAGVMKRATIIDRIIETGK